MSYLKICLEVGQIRKSNLTSVSILVQSSKFPNFVNKQNSSFLGKWGKSSNFGKILFWFWGYQIKSSKWLNIKIFPVIKYWHQARKCRIFWRNTKPNFWKSETNLEPFHNGFSNIETSYYLFLKFTKYLTRIFWVISFRCKVQKYQI